MDITGLIADHMGHFAVKDAVNMLVAVLFATLMATVLGMWGARRPWQEARRLGLWSGLAAAGIGFVKAQLPLAVALLAMALLLRPTREAGDDRLLTWSALVIGIGCGSGASLVVLVLLPVLVFLFRWAISRNEAAK